MTWADCAVCRRERDWSGAGGLVQSGSNAVGVGMAQFVEGGKCSPPGGAGGTAVSGGMVGVAEADLCVCRAEMVAGLAAQVQGALVAVDGLTVMAQVMVGVAKAVPGRGLFVMLADFPLQGEGI